MPITCRKRRVTSAVHCVWQRPLASSFSTTEGRSAREREGGRARLDHHPYPACIQRGLGVHLTLTYVQVRWCTCHPCPPHQGWIPTDPRLRGGAVGMDPYSPQAQRGGGCRDGSLQTPGSEGGGCRDGSLQTPGSEGGLTLGPPTTHGPWPP